MLRWAPYPMLRVAIFFIGGILLGIYYPNILPIPFSIVLFSILFLLYAAFSFSKLRLSFSLGSIGLLSVFLAGFLNVYRTNQSLKPDHLLHVNPGMKYYSAVVNGEPEEKANSWKVELRVNKIWIEGQWQRGRGGVNLYISKRSPVGVLQHGDVLLLNGAPQELLPPYNPGEFDYKRYLSFKNIYHQHFVVWEDLRIVDQGEPGIMGLSSKARRWAATTLKKYLPHEQHQAIALALILGVKDGLDNDLQTAYSASGAFHVLAVSGLHVGIIYGLLLLLLRPLNRFSWSSWVTTLISLLCLWAFAFITGLSPSVLRAVTMFSFVALSRPFGHRTNIYNTLAASAFLLLLFDPYLIMSVGFQLSYLAVLGIVYLQRPLYNLVELPNGWLDKIWQITCVSLAAQVATFSLSLLYFHQFPVYFLVSNLFVIPGAFLVLVLGIALLIASFAAPLAHLIGVLLSYIISFLNGIVFTIEKLPFSLIGDVYFTTTQCWLLMGLVVGVILLLVHRRIHYVVFSFMLTLAFSLISWTHFVSDIATSHMIVYRTPGYFAMDWIESGQTHFFADAELRSNESELQFYIHPNRLLHGVRKITVHDSLGRYFKGYTLSEWGGKRILRITETYPDLPAKAEVDYIVVSNRSLRSIKEIEAIKFSQLILDASNPSWYTQRIREEAEESNKSVFSVLDEGPFIVTL